MATNRGSIKKNIVSEKNSKEQYKKEFLIRYVINKLSEIIKNLS